MKTRGACLTGPGRIELRERTLELQKNEVLVRTELAGICGTDKGFFQGILPRGKGIDAETRKELVYPFFFGHEGGGTVVEVGSKVDRFSPGDRVISFGWNDTFADYFTAKEMDLEPVPEGMEMEIACLGEPIGCAVFSGLQSGVQLGDTVAVFGMGFAGQIMAQVAKKKGAFQVIAVDVREEMLALAMRLGADVALNAEKTDPVEAIFDLTDGRGVDVAVEMAGSEDSVNRCTASVRHNGILVFYSWITQDVTLNISRWHNNSLQIVNTGLVHHSPEERSLWTPLALRPLLTKQIEIAPLITHRYPLDEIEKGFEAANRSPDAVKVILIP